jgi:hypothetical protein
MWKRGARRLTSRRSTSSLSRGSIWDRFDKVTRIVRLGVSVATSGDVRDQLKVADAASELRKIGPDQAGGGSLHLNLIQPHAGLPPASKPNLLINSKRTIDVLPKPHNLKSY